MAVLAGSSGCGSGGEDPGASPRLRITTVARSGRVELAAARQGDGGWQIATSAGTAPAAGDRTFTVTAIEGGPQLAMVLTPAGQPMLLGWLSDELEVLSPRTTADVLLFFRLGMHLLPSDVKVRAVELIAAMPELEAVAEAIEAALDADPDSLANGDEAVSTALEAVATLVIEHPQPEPEGRDLTVSEGTKSGVTPSLPAGINELQLINTRRRRAYAWIDRVSYVPEGDGAPVPSPAEVTEFDVTPVKGANTLLGLAQDVLNGFVGSGWTYDPFYSEKIRLPATPDGAKSTLYRLTVVGVGYGAGDVDQLTGEQEAKLKETITRSFVCDFFLPIIINLVIPLKGDAIDDYVRWTNGSGTVQDIVGLLTASVPGIWEKAHAGDFDGALWDSYQTLQTSNTFRLLLLQKIMDMFIPDVQKANRFADLAQKFLNVLTLGDMILTGFDSILQAVAFAQSNRADIWQLTATPPNVHLDPEAASLTHLENVLLTAVVPSAQGQTAPGEQPPAFEYRWSNTGQCGSLTTTGHVDEQSFTTTESFVYYFADAEDSGQDTVAVEVYEIDGNRRHRVGSATATIEVQGTKVTLEPRGAVLGYGGAQAFAATVQPAPEAGQSIVYHWHNTAVAGSLSGGDDQEGAVAAVTYGAGDQDGQDTITVEAFAVSGRQRTRLGAAQAGVLVQEQASELRLSPGSLDLDNGASGGITASLAPPPTGHPAVTYLWTNTATMGHLTGGDQQLGDDASVEYRADAAGQGADTITCEASIVRAGARVVIGRRSVAVQVGLEPLELNFSSGVEHNRIDPANQESFVLFVKPPISGQTAEFVVSGGGAVGSLRDGEGNAGGSVTIRGFHYDGAARASVSDQAWLVGSWPQTPGATAELTCELYTGTGAQRVRRAVKTITVRASADWAFYGTLHYYEPDNPGWWFGGYKSDPYLRIPPPTGAVSRRTLFLNRRTGAYHGQDSWHKIMPLDYSGMTAEELEQHRTVWGELAGLTDYLQVGPDIDANEAAIIADKKRSLQNAGENMECVVLYSREDLDPWN